MNPLAILTYAMLLPLATALPTFTDSVGANTPNCQSDREQTYQHANTQYTNCISSTTAFAIEQLPVNTQVVICCKNGETGYTCPKDIGTIANTLTRSIAKTVSWNVEHAPPSVQCATQTPRLVVGKRDTKVVQEGQEDHEDKRYEFANSRVGVLVCRYGFCAIDFYCEEGMRCSDECTCCKDASVVEMETSAVV